MALFVSTVSTDISVSELGITLTHPTVNFEISTQFSAEEIKRANSLTTAIQGGTLTWKKTSEGSNELAADYDPDHVSVVDLSTSPGTSRLLTAEKPARLRQVVTQSSAATILTFGKVGQRFIWIQSRNAGYTQGTLIFSAVVVAFHIQVRVVNTTTGEVLGTSPNITTSGICTLAFTAPTADCSIEVQLSRLTNVTLGTNPQIQDAVFEFDTI